MGNKPSADSIVMWYDEETMKKKREAVDNGWWGSCLWFECLEDGGGEEGRLSIKCLLGYPVTPEDKSAVV